MTRSITKCCYQEFLGKNRTYVYILYIYTIRKIYINDNIKKSDDKGMVSHM